VRSRHDNGNIEQMIEMPMSNQNRVRLGRNVSHSLCDSRHVRSNAQAKRNAQKINTREVGIDQEGTPIELELVTICTQVRHAHPTPWRCASVLHNQISIRLQPRA
jgi:hypothetical protein